MLLSATEVAALRLNASVVVLAACDTELGTQFAGGFTEPGARIPLRRAGRVVATRWQISDRSLGRPGDRFLQFDVAPWALSPRRR